MRGEQPYRDRAVETRGSPIFHTLGNAKAERERQRHDARRDATEQVTLQIPCKPPFEPVHQFVNPSSRGQGVLPGSTEAVPRPAANRAHTIADATSGFPVRGSQSGFAGSQRVSHWLLRTTHHDRLGKNSTEPVPTS